MYINLLELLELANADEVCGFLVGHFVLPGATLTRHHTHGVCVRVYVSVQLLHAGVTILDMENIAKAFRLRGSSSLEKFQKWLNFWYVHGQTNQSRIVLPKLSVVVS